MEFEWDSDKNLTNRKKHFVSFEEAGTIWDDPHAVEFFDPDHSNQEDRFLRIGYSCNQRLLFVVFCILGSNQIARIISARKTTEQERRQYEEGI